MAVPEYIPTGACPPRAGEASCARLPDICSVLTAAIGLVVVVGWVFEIDLLKRVLPGLASMKLNTALGFLLAGAALWWRRRAPLRLTLGVMVGLVGALSLVEHLAGLDLGIDQLFVRDVVAGPEAEFPPGRMAPSTALCFVLLGLALLGIGDAQPRPDSGPRTPRRWGAHAAELLALTATIVGGFALVAYPTGVLHLRQLPGFVSMALHTAAAFVVLGVGILWAVNGSMVQSLRSRGTGRLLWAGFGLVTTLLAAVGIVFTANLDAVRMQTSGDLPLLLVASVLLALLTSGAVARSVARQERALREQREWLRVTLSSIGDGVIACDTHRRVTFINPVAATLTGWPVEEALGQPIGSIFRIVEEQTRAPAEDVVGKVLREGRTMALANHTALLARDGREIPIADSAAPILDEHGAVGGVVLVFRDVSAAVQARQEREATLDFLRLVNQSNGTSELLKAATEFFQRRSACDAVGIRLREGDDFPYCESRGFSSEFVRLENQLCVRDDAGRVKRESTGDPVIECMCGNVIGGRVDPSKPYFSEGGSFWTNDTTRLLATTSDDERQARTRNRCNGEGYQSVALVPLRVGDERLGLLQLNDPRKGMFSPERVALWERLAGYLAVAVARSQAAEALRELKERLEARVRERTSELERAMGALESERRRFHDVLEMLPVYVVLLTPDYRVPLANRFFENRYGKAEGRRCYEYLFHRTEPCDNCETFKVLETRAPHHWAWTAPDNRDYDIYDFPFTDTDGSPLIMEMGIDVTDKKRAEAALKVANATLEQRVAERTAELEEEIAERRRTEDALKEAKDRLEEADRRKNEFLAVLSHELRNPLAPISNSLHVLDRAAPGGTQATRAKEVIDRQVGHLSHLVDDLLDLTRISRNKIQLQRTRVNLCDVVRRCVEDQRSLFERSEVTLALDIPGDPLFVLADANRVAQVVGNLLQNAAKFTGRGGNTQVTVASDPARQRAMVRVLDTGVGMTPETLSGLFQPFMQADRTLDRSQGGLGLGLALVKGLVELHGGEVTAHSAGHGKGAELVVTLPQDGVAAAPPQDQPSVPRCSRRVLVIEDNLDAADSLRDALELCGHEIKVAYNGPDGISRARESRPEVVLCDIGLPGMDGYEVARTLRADETLDGVFLVALSGYALPEDLQRAREAGFQRHLAKPPSLETLEQLLAEFGDNPEGV